MADKVQDIFGGGVTINQIWAHRFMEGVKQLTIWAKRLRTRGAIRLGLVISKCTRCTIRLGLAISNPLIVEANGDASKSNVNGEKENNSSLDSSSNTFGRILALIILLWFFKIGIRKLNNALVRFRGPKPDPFYSFEGPPVCDTGKKHSISDPDKPNNRYINQRLASQRTGRFITFAKYGIWKISCGKC